MYYKNEKHKIHILHLISQQSQQMFEDHYPHILVESTAKRDYKQTSIETFSYKFSYELALVTCGLQVTSFKVNKRGLATSLELVNMKTFLLIVKILFSILNCVCMSGFYVRTCPVHLYLYSLKPTILKTVKISGSCAKVYAFGSLTK